MVEWVRERSGVYTMKAPCSPTLSRDVTYSSRLMFHSQFLTSSAVQWSSLWDPWGWRGREWEGGSGRGEGGRNVHL